MREICVCESNGKCEVEEFFKSANKKIQNKLKFQLDIIKDEKTLLIEPYVKHFSIEKYRQFYELRIRAAGMMVRVVFYEQENKLILLHAFYKRGNKDTQKALETSLKLLNSLQEDDEIIYRGIRL